MTTLQWTFSPKYVQNGKKDAFSAFCTKCVLWICLLCYWKSNTTLSPSIFSLPLKVLPLFCDTKPSNMGVIPL